MGTRCKFCHSTNVKKIEPISDTYVFDGIEAVDYRFRCIDCNKTFVAAEGVWITS